MGGVIYEPRGRAREYAPLACNLYETCPIGCTYCFNPAVLHKTPEDFHKPAVPRKNILQRLANDCRKMVGDPREILLCFTCDPCACVADGYLSEALEIFQSKQMKVTILTKRPTALTPYLSMIYENGWSIGVTLAWTTDSKRREYEPGADSVADRLGSLIVFHNNDIRTWVSVEPVIDPVEALNAMLNTVGFVDHYKVGKLNARSPELKAIEKSIHWRSFYLSAKIIVTKHKKSCYFKNDLLIAAGEAPHEHTPDR